MKTFIQLENKPERELPEKFKSDDVRYPENFVKYFLEQFTKEGDIILDPFAGFGTTMLVSEAMNRVAYGIEYDEDHFQYTKSQLKHPERLIHGDSLKLDSYDLPQFDFCLTSPPYMGAEDEENPFTAYTEPGQGYAQYLSDITTVYKQVSQLMKPAAKVVVEVSNVKQPRGVTTLAWDIGKSLAKVMTFEGEIVVGWTPTYGMGYDHSYALVYSKRVI